MAKSESNAVSGTTPVPPEERRLSTLDLTLLWFGAAIAISEIWGGGSGGLTALGLGLGLCAILLGRVVGNGLMAAMAVIGARSGLPTLVLTRPAFGIRGSYIPSIFNVLQLLGWTGWMLFVGFSYMDVLAPMCGLPSAAELPLMRYVWILLLGFLCTLWASGGQPFWHKVQAVSSALLFLLTVAMTVLILREHGLGGLSSGTASPFAMLAGADFVVAMSVSWLPLVADYSRYARNPRAAAAGTFWGYFIGGTWMYAAGLLLVLATGSTQPDSLAVEIMGRAGTGWAVAAIMLVLVSTVTTTFLDIFSTVVSAENLFPKIPLRSGSIAVGLLGTLIALFLETSAFEPFLLAIGAIFLPAFSVVLADYYLVRRSRISVEAINQQRGPYWFTGGFSLRALTAWLAGFIVYDMARGFPSLLFFTSKFGINPPIKGWEVGASLPCIAVSVGLYLLLSLPLILRTRDSAA